MMLTPSMIWKDFSTDDALNCSVVKEYEENNIIYREMYFSASTMCDGVTRVYGVFACQKDTEKRPAILYCHNAGMTIDMEVIRQFAQRGYAVLGYDYSGESENRTRFTIYPKSLDYANYSRSMRHMTHADGEVTDTAWYAWTVVARYALKLLSEQKETDASRMGVVGIRGGGYFSWQLASFCPEVKAAVSLFEGGWTEYLDRYKYGTDSEIEVDDERERWLAGVATQVYAKHVKTPFLYLGATNDRQGNCDRVNDTLLRMSPELAYYAFAPNLCNLVTKSMEESMYAFLKRFVRGENAEFPHSPVLTLLREEEGIVAYIAAEQKPDLYVSRNEINSCLRYWQKADNIQPCEKQIDGKNFTFCAKLPVYGGDILINALAAVKYENGVFLTSHVAAAKLIDKEIKTTKREHSRMVFGGELSALDFTEITDQTLSDSLCTVPDGSVCVEAGAFGVCGVTAHKYDLATFKLRDARFCGESESILKFDLCCKTAGKLRVIASQKYMKENEVNYVATVELFGGELWQKAEIDRETLKSPSGASLPSWQSVDCLIFQSDEKFLLTNMIWL